MSLEEHHKFILETMERHNDVARKFIAELEAENAKLKKEADLWKLRSDNWQKYVQLLEEERLRLKKAGTEMGKHLPDTDEANKAYNDFENGGRYK